LEIGVTLGGHQEEVGLKGCEGDRARADGNREVPPQVYRLLTIGSARCVAHTYNPSYLRAEIGRIEVGGQPEQIV
jgi:hypothetical protein